MAYDIYETTSLLTIDSIDIGTLDFGGADATGVAVTDTSDGVGDGLDTLGDFTNDTFEANGETYEYAGVATDDLGNVIGFIGYQPGILGLLFSTYALIVPEGTVVPPALSVTLISGNTGDTSTQWDIDAEAPVCFLQGTLIQTPAGERPVESLQPGDLVLTHDGREMPVRWMGRSTCTLPFANAARATPVVIAAGALGNGLPRRDLHVSPTHAIHLDGALVQAEALINGAGIRRQTARAQDTFVYHHIELDEHALVLAEGLASESFADGISLLRFDNWAERQALRGNRRIPQMDLPRLRAFRQLPLSRRQALAASAPALVG